jgi:transposase-like protein
MSEISIEQKAASKIEYWRELVAEQERSGISVKCFCQDHGLGEHLFYYWRRRLREQQEPMRLAVVEARSARPVSDTKAVLELVLVSGDRLRIGAGVDRATLRTVVEALRS